MAGLQRLSHGYASICCVLVHRDARNPWKHRDLSPVTCPEGGSDPEHEALLADSVGLALLVVLETLNPAERLAFVLRGIFAVPFDEIAHIVERSETAARQLASRARRQVREEQSLGILLLTEQRAVVDAFLAASREETSMRSLTVLIDPNVVFRHEPHRRDGRDTRGAEWRDGGGEAVRGASPGSTAYARKRLGRRRGCLRAGVCS